MNLPRVSILMPVRNEERFLPAALRSLFSQSFTDWELVVVDDHSTDATPAILAAAAASDRRVRTLTPLGRGLVAALNQGLAQCRAGLVARMDGDDVCHPRRLETQVAVMHAHHGLGLLGCSFRHFPRRDIRVGMRTYEEWQNSLITHDEICRDLFVESPFVHPSVMIRSNLLVESGGYRDRGWAEDYDLWLRLAASGCRFARTEETLFFWRDRPERSTRTMQEYTADAFRRCKGHHLAHGFLKGHDAVTLIGAGTEGRAWRKVLADVGISVTRWVDLDPRKVGRILHGAPVVAANQVGPGSGPMLVTIGTRGARAGIREWASGRGLVEGADFLCIT